MVPSIFTASAPVAITTEARQVETPLKYGVVKNEPRTMEKTSSNVSMQREPTELQVTRRNRSIVKAEPTSTYGAVHQYHQKIRPRWRSGVLRPGGCQKKVSVADAQRSWKAARNEPAVSVKTELRDSGTKLPRKRRWDAVRHFKHQVAIVRQLIPKPRQWNIFLSNLGTGIVGVRPKLQRKDKGRKPATVDAQGYIILFLNAAAARLQKWHGRTMSGFESVLDRKTGTLKWESQRKDRNGRMIARICEHTNAGGKVVVAVRDAPGKSFRILGSTSSFRPDGDGTARFLVGKGEHVIAEQGCRRVHRTIRAQCLEDGLKCGVGLVAYKYPLPKTFGTPNYCPACCWAPARATLTFSKIDEEAAKMFEAGAADHSPRSIPVAESFGADFEPPRKRLRVKQPLVKRDSSFSVDSAGTEDADISVDPALMQIDDAIDVADTGSQSKTFLPVLTGDVPAVVCKQRKILATEREQLLERLADVNNQLLIFNRAESLHGSAKGGAQGGA